MRQFQVTTGTIYENSNLPLRTWFLTFYILSVSKKGISSIELSKTLGITQKSAWYLLHKIRYMLEHSDGRKPMTGIVEADETYIGGKKRGGKRGRGAENKVPVFGIVQRKNDIYIVPVKNARRKTLEPIIHERVRAGTHIMTDEWTAYRGLYKNYEHEVVNHGRREYVRGLVHTNSLEGAWSHLKRTLLGTYHRPSREHLSKYCAEFQFNYNTRKYLPERKFRKSISLTNSRITYKDIVPRV